MEVLSVLLNPEQVTFNCYMDLEDKQNQVPKMQDQFSYELQWPTLPGK